MLRVRASPRFTLSAHLHLTLLLMGSQCSDSCHIQYRAEATNVLLRGFKDLHDMWALGIVGIV